jgi:hypothetical protein
MKKAVYDVTLKGITVTVKAHDRFEALYKARHKVERIIKSE